MYNTAIFILLAQAIRTASSDLNFLSGVADTTQHFAQRHPGDGNAIQNDDARIVKRHHLICLHKGPFRQYNKVYNTSPEKCCNDLWLKGLILTDQRQYCVDHMALLPDVQSPAASMASLIDAVNFARRDVRPMHYLAIDEVIDRNRSNGSTSASFVQVRQIMARDEHNERESIRDLPEHGVAAYSPFHVVDFMFGGRDAVEYIKAVHGDDSIISLIIGRVNGELSADGGMHRAFHQRLTLLVNPKVAQSWDSKQLRFDINATVLLPLMENIFIDADDALLVEYDSVSSDSITCRTSLLSENNRDIHAKCNIEFITPQTIDIEQPSFASQQYVVAFQIHASIEFSTVASMERMQQMQLLFEYGTTIHTRYQLPLSIDGKNNELRGIMPVAIEQPVLYTATARLLDRKGSEAMQFFVLDTATLTESSQDSYEPTTPIPLVINVAVGVDDDYFLVTSITLLSALIGGFIVIRSIDLVSIWA